MTKMNAFHPDYVKTYMPELLSTIKADEKKSLNGKAFGAHRRATMESTGEIVLNTITHFPKVKRVSIAPKEFFVYSKAGAPKP